MANLEDKVFSFNIATDEPSVTRKGFGTVMALVSGVTFTDDIRYYTSAKEAADDATLNQVAKDIVSVCFAHKKSPAKVAIGKSTASVKQKDQLILTGPTADADYKIIIDLKEFLVNGTGKTTDEIVTEFNTLINADAEFNSTNTVASQIIIEAAVAGNGHNIVTEIPTGGGAFAHSNLTANDGLEDDLNRLLPSDWFHFVLSEQDDVKSLKAAAWAQSAKRMFWCSTPDSTSETSTVTDLGAVCKSLSYDYVNVIRSKEDNHIDASISSFFSSFDLDSLSPEARFLTLKGFAAQGWTSTELVNLLSKNVNIYDNFKGLPSYFPGVVASGKDVEFITFLALIQARICEAEAQFFKNRANSGVRVSFADEDFTAIVGEIRNVFIAQGPNGAKNLTDVFEVSAPLRSTIVGLDETQEKLKIKFGAQYSGKTRTVDFNGIISIKFRSLGE